MKKRLLWILMIMALLVISILLAFLKGNDGELPDDNKNRDYQGKVIKEELYVIRDNGKFGYINKSGLVVIKPQFDEAYNFSDGLARIAMQHKYGFIDKSGRIVIEPIYDDAGDFSEGLAGVAANNKYGFIDISGREVIPLQYELVSEFSEGVAGIYYEGKWGFIDSKGKVVIKPIYNNVGFFREGLAPVSQEELFGYINKKGEYVISPQFNYADNFSEGLAEIGINNKYGYVDAKGKMVIKNVFQCGYGFSEGMAAVMQNGKWGYIDKNGNFLIKPIYHTGNSFSEGLAAVYDGRNWGFIDKRGNMVINPQYPQVERYCKGLAMVRHEDSSSYIDENGKLIWHEVEAVDIQGPDSSIGRLIKMKTKSSQYDLLIKYPHVINMEDKALQEKINKLLSKQCGIDYGGKAGETYRQDFDVMLNKKGVMSIVNKSDMYTEGAAHGLSMLSSINIDMTDGKIYELKELFKPEADYKSKLNRIIENKLLEDNIPLLREFEGIGDKQEFYLRDKELVVYYQLYDYTPYAYGFLEFYIPFESIKDIADKKGILGRLMSAK